jgi:hypothetical protein
VYSGAGSCPRDENQYETPLQKSKLPLLCFSISEPHSWIALLAIARPALSSAFPGNMNLLYSDNNHAPGKDLSKRRNKLSACRCQQQLGLALDDVHWDVPIERYRAIEDDRILIE